MKWLSAEHVAVATPVCDHDVLLTDDCIKCEQESEQARLAQERELS